MLTHHYNTIEDVVRKVPQPLVVGKPLYQSRWTILYLDKPLDDNNSDNNDEDDE